MKLQLLISSIIISSIFLIGMVEANGEEALLLNTYNVSKNINPVCASTPGLMYVQGITTNGTDKNPDTFWITDQCSRGVWELNSSFSNRTGISSFAIQPGNAGSLTQNDSSLWIVDKATVPITIIYEFLKSDLTFPQNTFLLPIVSSSFVKNDSNFFQISNANIVLSKLNGLPDYNISCQFDSELSDYACGNSQAITTNGSEFWTFGYVGQQSYIVKINSTGTAVSYRNITSICPSIGGGACNSLTTSNGNDFWITLYGGAYEDSKVYHISYDSPNITLSSPANNTESPIHWQNLTANLSDSGVGLKNATLFIKNDLGAIVNITSIDIAGAPLDYQVGIEYTFSDGEWKWYYEVWDLADNYIQSEQWNFSTSTLPPVSFPANATSPPDITDYFEGDWTNQAIQVHLQCLSDCTNMYYCLSSSDTSCDPLLGTLVGSSADIIISSFNGIKHLYYAGTSTLSLLNEDAKYFELRMDTVSPNYTSNFTYPDSGIDYSPSQDYQFNITWVDTNSTISSAILSFNEVNYSMNNENNEYYYTLNGLAAGTYSYYFWANDSANNQNSTELQTFVVRQDSSTGMSITGDSPITYGTTSNFAGLETNIGDADCVYSLDLSDDIYGVGDWIFNYSTAGCTNYTGGSVTRTLSVSKNSSLLYLYLNNTQSDFQITQGGYSLINATISSGEGTIELFNNGTSINNGSSPLINETYFYLIGDYNITVIHPSTQNYTESFITLFVNSVAETIAPNVSLINPANNTINSSSSEQNFTANFTDNLGVKNATLYIYTQGGEIYNQTSSEEFSEGVTDRIYGIIVSITEGIYEWFYHIWDWGGNDYLPENNTFTYDITSPSIVLDSPLEQTYNVLNISLNFTITDAVSGVSACWYKIENSTNIIADNFTISNCENSTINMSDDGEYTINFYSNDSANNLNVLTRNFEIATSYPTVVLVSPEQQIVNYNTFYFNYTPTSGVGLDTCELWGNWSGTWEINQSTILSPSSGVLTNFSAIRLADGRYLWNVKCNDTNGLDSFAFVDWEFEVDTTSPVLTVDFPSETIYDVRNISLNVSSEDINPSASWWYSLNGESNKSFSPNSTILAFAGENNIIVYNEDSVNNLGLSIVYFNVSYENILEIAIKPFDIFFGTNLTLEVDVNPHNLEVSYCNFNLINPSGRIFIYDLTGTMEDTEGKLWTSESYVINESGEWTYNVTCENSLGLSAGEESYFIIEPYSVISNPYNYTFAARNYRNETNTFSVYMYDNSNESINYSIDSYIENSSNFTLSHHWGITLDDNDTDENQYFFTFSINATEDVEDGWYNGYISLTNPLNSEISYVYFTYGIKPPSGLPRLRYGPDLCTDENPGVCNNYNISLIKNNGFSIDYNVSNDGGYDLTDCSLLFTGGLDNSWIAESLGIFNLSINHSKEFTVSFVPTSTGIFGGYIYIKCRLGDALNSEVQNPPSNWIFNKVIVTLSGEDIPGGGGGSAAPVEPLNITEILAGICGNNICEPAYNETFLTCPEDCQGSLEPISSCFSSDPKIRAENCLFYQATGIIYIFVFIALIVLFTLFFEYRKNKKGNKFVFVGLAPAPAKKRRR